MQKVIESLHNAASEYGRGVEGLGIRAMSPSEQKLVAAIVGATTQAILSKLAEALTYTDAARGGGTQSAIDAILRPPMPPAPPKQPGSQFISQSQQARKDAIRDYAGPNVTPSSEVSITPPYAPPSSKPE